ncbi:MAG: dTMP kinase [Candidatus Kariarchaeaceae archaeon]|jgi:dTMP kinase
MGNLLIDFEGLDGSGKNTQSKLLVNKLTEMGYDVLYISYPEYDSIYGKILHDFLYSKINLSPEEQFMVYLLDMVKDKSKVKNHLQEGNIVIMDRYFMSTIAYQCANGFEFDKAKQITEILQMTIPDIILYFDVPAEESYRRKQKQKKDLDRFEKDLAFLNEVTSFYKKMVSESFPTQNWITFDALDSESSLHDKIMIELNKLLKKG